MPSMHLNKKISLEYNISKEAIYSEINKLIYGKNEDEKRINVTKVVQPQKKVIEETDKAVAKRESLIIYLLINYPNEAYSKIKEVVSVEDIKSERNKKVITKLYEELEKGYSNINNVLDWFQEEEIINYLTSIMAYDFEITEVNKCIEDILNIYIKEKLIKKRNDIINKLENKELDKEDKANYEKQLSEIIVKLAKVK